MILQTRMTPFKVKLSQQCRLQRKQQNDENILTAPGAKRRSVKQRILLMRHTGRSKGILSKTSKEKLKRAILGNSFQI